MKTDRYYFTGTEIADKFWKSGLPELLFIFIRLDGFQEHSNY